VLVVFEGLCLVVKKCYLSRVCRNKILRKFRVAGEALLVNGLRQKERIRDIVPVLLPESRGKCRRWKQSMQR
jgi:hypothetical protein